MATKKKVTPKTPNHKKGGAYTEEQREKLKVAYVENLVKCGCIAEAAQRAVGVTNKTITDWREKDPDFDAACNNAEAISVGEAASMLWDSMKEGNATSIIFYLKTRGSKYGFKENQQIDLNGLLAQIPRGFNGVGEK